MPTVWLKRDCLDPSHASSNIMSNIRWTLHYNDRPNHCFITTNLRRFKFLMVFKCSFPLLHMFFRCLLLCTLIFKYGYAGYCTLYWKFAKKIQTFFYVTVDWVVVFALENATFFYLIGLLFSVKIPLNFNALALFNMFEAIYCSILVYICNFVDMSFSQILRLLFCICICRCKFWNNLKCLQT